MYLPVPIFGYLCDRYSPSPMALSGAILFGFGYLLAAFTFKSGPPGDTGYGNGWPFGVMILAFVGIGMGTSATYLSAVATCAKNFGKSKHAGLVLAFPIAAFGLSGMWQSQIGEHLLKRKGSGELDVFRYFIFLGCLLIAVDLLGSLGLRIVGEEDLIDERVEELERSGLLEESEFFRPKPSRQNTSSSTRNYGTVQNGSNESVDTDDDADEGIDLTESMILVKQREAEAREQESQKKNWLLNLETRNFLSDPTMWFLAGAFFLLTGPGEAYINNLGTIIKTLTPISWAAPNPPARNASTHVSIVAITSTFARLLTGALCDLLAPRAEASKARRVQPDHSSESGLPADLSGESPEKVAGGVSRVYLLMSSTFLLLLCYISVGALVPSNPSLFPLSSALLGLGYGA